MKKLVVICAASGVGKSTVKTGLINKLDKFVCLEDLLNWWEYKGTSKEDLYYDDCLKEAVRLSCDKDIILATCMNPYDFYTKVKIPKEITSTFFIGLTCSSEELINRLKARPKERMCDSEEFINSQIEYNKWFKDNSGKFQFFIDNTNLSINRTIEIVLDFINHI